MAASPSKPVLALALAPEDWFWALWRSPTPLQRPGETPFDRADAEARFARVSPADSYGKNKSWSKAKIARAISREEALFWWDAMVKRDAASSDRPSAEIKLSANPRALPATHNAIDVLYAFKRAVPAEMSIVLAKLYPLEEVIEVLVRIPPAQWHWLHGTHDALLAGFRAFVLPYLDRDELTTLREIVRRYQTPWKYDPYAARPLWLRFAAALGMSDLVRPAVESIGVEGGGMRIDDWVLELIYGLDGADEVEIQSRCLRLHPIEPEHIRGWLAHTEWSALEWVGDGILLHRRKPAVTAAISALGLARGPQTAAVMIDLVARSKAPEQARAWLDRYPAFAAEALVSVAAGRGKTAEAAAAWLRTALRGKAAGTIEAALAEGSPATERVRKAVEAADESDTPLPVEFVEALEAVTGNPPTWVCGSDLPPILVVGLPLSASQADRVLAALRSGTLDEPSPLITVLKRHADMRSLDDFAWRLCELWQQHGRKLKENWALAATGVIGGDGCAMKLGPLAKSWREQIMHQPAMMAIECLRVNGSDMALWQLREFTRIPRDWSLKETARQHLEAVARTRSLSFEALEDRMTPACGLDEDGSRTFDFGPRQFRFVLGNDLEPLVRDGEGAIRKDLPKPGVRDHAAKAEAAVAAWKLIKKQVSEIARMQARRLEDAMVVGRRWSASDFQTLFVRHPLLGLLARKLVWGAYCPESGRLMGTFRVSEDQTLATIDDEPFRLVEDAQVGIPHPLHLEPEVLALWGERLADYEIFPPFPQIGRPIHRLEPEERSETEIKRFAHIPTIAVALRSGLEARGWTADTAGDGGCISNHLRSFATPDGDVTACVYYPGIPVWSSRDAPPQTIDSCIFLKGAHSEMPWSDDPPLPLGEVDPLVMSEVLGDLAYLTRHGGAV